MIGKKNHNKLKAIFMLGIWLFVIGLSGAATQNQGSQETALVNSDHRDAFAIQVTHSVNDFSLPVETPISSIPFPTKTVQLLFANAEGWSKTTYTSHPLQSKLLHTLFRVIISSNAP